MMKHGVATSRPTAVGDHVSTRNLRMMRCRWRAWAAAAQILALLLWARPSFCMPEIWVAAVDDTPAILAEPPTSPVIRGMQVFKVSTQYVLNASEGELRSLLQTVQRHGVLFAVEALMLPGQEGRCGRGVEGYSSPGTMRKVAERIQSLGGRLDAVAMDEPLWFGRHYKGRQACRDTVAEVARHVAASARDIWAIFPNARIGDIEPVSDQADAEWLDLLAEWPAAYAAAAGRPLDFLHLDVDWDRRWRSPLLRIARFAHEVGLPLGIIYNASPNAATATAWTEAAERHIEILEQDLKLRPEHVVFQSWMPQVRRVLPSSEPGTLGWLLVRYMRPTPVIEAVRQEAYVRGRILNVAGEPLVNQAVQLIAPGVAPNGLVTLSIDGLVPADATAALLAVRLNTECSCRAAADLILRAATYQRQGDAGAQAIPLPRSSEMRTNRFTASQEQRIAANGESFPVIAGTGFTITIQFQATSRAEDAGFVAIIFLNREGQEVRRLVHFLGPFEMEQATVHSDADGSFAFSHGEAGWKVRTPPTERFRAAVVSLR